MGITWPVGPVVGEDDDDGVSGDMSASSGIVVGVCTVSLDSCADALADTVGASLTGDTAGIGSAGSPT